MVLVVQKRNGKQTHLLSFNLIGPPLGPLLDQLKSIASIDSIELNSKLEEIENVVLLFSCSFIVELHLIDSTDSIDAIDLN